ncbi:MAG: flagellar biosynthesis anti-sigma factor FlgM [Oligoflexia bacterium]|nr:flagellar biosynthesis anti-sigma factor FlgM [Oligoflexia bacterium]
MKITEKNYADQTSGAEGLGKSKAAQSKKINSQSGALKPQGSGVEELGSAKVNLSDRAQDIKKIREKIAATPDVDEAKVLKYKSMLAKGDYKVDSKAIADKMVDEHLKNDFFNVKGNED